jgi:hypothetical protein
VRYPPVENSVAVEVPMRGTWIVKPCPETWEEKTELKPLSIGSLFLRDAITLSAKTEGAAWIELAMG